MRSCGHLVLGMHASTDRHALSVVESAYEIVDDLEGWLEGVLRSVTPLLDLGHGVHGYVYVAHPSGTVAARSTVLATDATPPGFAEAAEQAIALTPRPMVAGLYCRAPSIALASVITRALGLEAFPEYRPFDVMRDFGVQDMLGVAAYDPSGIGVLLCAPTDSVHELDAGTVERWQKLRTHLLAGLRLQRALAAPTAEPDAVLDPTGRVLHAEGTASTSRAREALRERARHIDRARSAAGQRDPARALEAWRGLVDGAWSLVDRFDSDGRRYLVARRNDPSVTIPRTLSTRERQILAYAALGHSNKHIAYTLGLAPSTISTHLRRAMRCVGVGDRATLALLWPALNDSHERELA